MHKSLPYALIDNTSNIYLRANVPAEHFVVFKILRWAETLGRNPFVFF